MNKKVSIIIPIFNTEKYLNECLDSVINQTYQNLEIILINDGSIDNSLKICREYEKSDGRIIVIDKKNTGVSNTRNIGLETATGTYITFVDSDDWLEANAIEIMVECIEKEKVDIVRTNFAINNEIGQINQSLLKKYDKKDLNELLYYFLNAEVPAYMCLFLIKKEIIDNNNLKLNESVVMMEDTLFFVNVIQKINSIYLTNVKTYNYRVYENSSSNSLKRIQKNIDSVLKVNQEITSILTNSELIEVTSRTEFRIITDFLFKLRKAGYNNKIVDTFNSLINNKQFHKMMKNLNYKKLIKKNKNVYKSFKYKKISILFKELKKAEFNQKVKDFNSLIKYKINRIYNKYLKKEFKKNIK